MVNRLKEDSVVHNEKILEIVKKALDKYKSTFKATSKYCETLEMAKELAECIQAFGQSFKKKEIGDKEGNRLLEIIEKLAEEKAEFNEIAFLRGQYDLAKAWNAKAQSLLSAEVMNIVWSVDDTVEKLAQSISLHKGRNSQKVKKSEAAQLLEEGNTFYIKFTDEISALRHGITAAIEWEKQYADLIKTGFQEDDLRKLMNLLLNMKFAPENVDEFFALFEELENISIMIDQMCGQIGHEKENCAMHQTTFAEVEKLVSESKYSKLIPKEKTEKMMLFKSKVSKWREEYSAKSQDLWSVEEISRLMDQAEGYTAHIPEYSTLKERKMLITRVKELSLPDHTITAEKLNELFRKAQEMQAPQEILQSLKPFIMQAETTAKDIQRFLTGSMQETCNKSSEVCVCIQEASRCKVVVPELQRLKELYSACEWCSKVSKLCNLPLSDEYGYEELEKIPISELGNLVEASKNISSSVGHAAETSVKAQQVFWSMKTADALKTILNEAILAEIDKERVRLQITEEHTKFGPLCKRLKEMVDTIKYLNVLTAKLDSADIDSLTKDQIREIVDSILKAKKKAAGSQVEWSECIPKLDKLGCLLISCREVIELFERNTKMDIKALVMLHHRVTGKSGAKLKYSYLLENEIKKYNEWIQRYDFYKAAAAKTIATSSKDKLLSLIKDGENIKYIDLSSQLQVLSKEAQASDVLETEANNIINETRNRTLKEDTEGITTLIDKMTSSQTYDQGLIRGLRASKLIAQMFAYYKSAKGSSGEWVAMLNERGKLLCEENPLNTSLQEKDVEDVVSKVKVSTQLASKIRSLGKSETKPLFAIVKALLESANQSKIDLSREKEILRILLQEGTNFALRYKELKDNKADISEYRKYKSELQRAQVSIPEVETDLNKTLLSATKFAQELDSAHTEAKLKKSVISSKAARALLQEYEKVQFKAPDAETIAKKYSESMKCIQSAKDSISAARGNPKFRMENLIEIQESLKKLEINCESDCITIFAEIWTLKYERLITRNKDLDQKPSYSAIKELISEGARLKDLNAPVDQSKLEHLKAIMSDAEIDIMRIMNIKDVHTLERAEGEMAKKYINYSDYFVEQRKTAIKEETPVFESKKRKLPEVSVYEPKEQGGNKRLASGSPKLELKSENRADMHTDKQNQHGHADSDFEKDRQNCSKQLFDILKLNPSINRDEPSIVKLAKEIENCLFEDYYFSSEKYKKGWERVARVVKALPSFETTSIHLLKRQCPFYQIIKDKDFISAIQEIEKYESDPKSVEKKEQHSAHHEDRSSQERRRQRKEKKSNFDVPPEKASMNDTVLYFVPHKKKDQEEESQMTFYPEKMQRYSPKKKSSPVPDDEKQRSFSDEENDKDDKYEKYDKDDKHDKDDKDGKDDEFDKEDKDNKESEDDDNDKGKVHKAWSGIIESTKGNMECSMCTKDYVSHTQNTPEIPLHLTVSGNGRMHMCKVYLEKIKDSRMEMVVKGWIEPLSSSLSIVDEYAKQLNLLNRCGIIDIKDIGWCIYLIPWVECNLDIFKSWNISPVMCEPKLAFFCVYKPVANPSVAKQLNPTLITTATDDKQLMFTPNKETALEKTSQKSAVKIKEYGASEQIEVRSKQTPGRH